MLSTMASLKPGATLRLVNGPHFFAMTTPLVDPGDNRERGYEVRQRPAF